MPYSSYICEAGSHQNFVHETKHAVEWDRSNVGFTFPLQKKTVSV